MRLLPFALLAAFAFALAPPLPAQAPATGSLLAAYVQEGIAGNQGLKQQQFQLDKALYALEEAKGLFRPTVSAGGSYTLAVGGRKQELPIGDLFNPVYATLNQMTGTQNFPQIENAEIAFLPNNFYDFRIRTVQPLVNAEIRYNRRIKEQQLSVKSIEIQVYERELEKNIKSAYFQYLQATEAESIYRNALTLLRESRRVNESLVKNDMAIPGVLIRTDGEIAKIEAQLTEIQANQRNAAAYFNYLLNRPLASPVAVDSALLTSAFPISPLVDSAQLSGREELQQLAAAAHLSETVVAMNRAYHLPKVGVQVDLGSQAFNFDWGGYVLAGLSVDIPLYAGNRNEAKIKQAEADVAALRAQTQQVEDQLALQVALAQNDYAAAVAVLQQREPLVAAAARYYKDVMRRYKEGQASFIEVLDARTELTTAETQQSLARTAAWQKWVALERALPQ